MTDFIIQMSLLGYSVTASLDGRVVRARVKQVRKAKAIQSYRCSACELALVACPVSLGHCLALGQALF